jgi:2-iminobutanoate/2-iminopropanoate deaminase
MIINKKGLNNMSHAIQTHAAPQAIGPYSQAVQAGKLLFVSGQLPIDPDTGVIHGETVAEQTGQCLKNLRAIIESADLTMSQVVKTTVYLKDLSQFSAMNEVYAGFFSGVTPARAAVEVARLPKDALVEIEAIACLE